MIDSFLYWRDHRNQNSGEIKGSCQIPLELNLLFIEILCHELQKLKASLTATSIFLYLQRGKSWVQVKRMFFVITFLLKLYITIKPVHISTIFWFNSKIAGIYRLRSTSVFMVSVYLQVMKHNKLYSRWLQHFEKKIQSCWCRRLI